MKGTKRVLVFCLMTAVIPSILIIIPLYLRHVVFADVVYPVAESDVLQIREGTSSIFCKSLALRMNSTFNAFILQGKPVKSGKIRHIRLKKSMSLPDDTLEYWGFYLLKGSVVKLKGFVRTSKGKHGTIIKSIFRADPEKLAKILNQFILNSKGYPYSRMWSNNEVCSRFDGSRILVVRGDKNLDTCNLMKHEKYGAKMDAEFNRVKVFYEKQAEVVDLIDITNNDLDEKDNNKAEEDLSVDNKEVIDSNIKRTRRKNDFQTIQKLNYGNSKIYNKMEEETIKPGGENFTGLRHARSHMRKRQKKIEELQKSLEEPHVSHQKRSISPLDSHIKHGGNALNDTEINSEGDSVSSFETDLLTCYDGKILLSRSFQPSRLCNNVEYLDQSNHMVTEHTVASDGYYYYIFYSDNDFVKNEVHAVFNIYKTTYGFKNITSGKECINQTLCEFPIQMMGDESVIVEVPTRDGIEHEEDDITLLSTCRPRTEVYVVFPILVLVLILVCAFL